MPDNSNRLPVELYSAEQVRELDRIAIEDIGVPGYTLMQRAARFSYETLKENWPEANTLAVVCGGGNNAGDGYVLAKLALEECKQVSVINLIESEKLKGNAATAYQDLLSTNIIPIEFSSSALEGVDVIVDALFGTGLDRDVKGKFYDAITVINASDNAVLSIDIPSGLNADTGNVMNVTVNADITATFIGLKKGMFTGDGLAYSGKIKFDALGVPEETYQRLGQDLDNNSVIRLEPEDLYHVLKPRMRNAHKGHFGHVLIIGGDQGYLGAVRMAAEAAARTGAGLVSIATRSSHASLLSTIRPEIMSHGVETLDDLMPLIRHADVIAIGPGLGQSEWARLLLARVLESGLPLVIDADALNLLAEEDQSSMNWVITPHPGEAARLLKTESKTIQSDRFKSARMLHEKYHGPVVLKGCGSLIADTDGQIFVCDAGNPGMSSGGMGDVLTGVIAGLIAQGIDINHATKLGVCLHANAADRAARAGERGMMALDVMLHLRNLVNPYVPNA
ncbi:MAG: NAD(P)H-hydrate dehydratase [Proteobacteria bacterium]|nr:NAD(P)H-hydrate dehydratase [Pseudomonadota bacterium]